MTIGRQEKIPYRFLYDLWESELGRFTPLMHRD